MPSKPISVRVSHQLSIGVVEVGTKDGAGSGKMFCVECTYADGSKVAGPDAEQQPHPALIISASDQDDIVWTSKHPFWVNFENGPTGVFFRPLPWKSVKGRDNLHRVHSGPVNPQACSFLPKLGMELKFMVTKRKHDDTDEADPDVCPLDPHVIVEP